MWAIVPELGEPCVFVHLLSGPSAGRHVLCTICWHTHLQASFCDCSMCQPIRPLYKRRLQWDSWTKSVLQVHHGMGGDFVCMQELALAAQLLWTDTLGIEANHATIRRSLTVTSTQTHTMDVEELAISHLRIHRGESPQAEEGDCDSHVQGGAFLER